MKYKFEEIKKIPISLVKNEFVKETLQRRPIVVDIKVFNNDYLGVAYLGVDYPGNYPDKIPVEWYGVRPTNILNRPEKLCSGAFAYLCGGDVRFAWIVGHSFESGSWSPIWKMANNKYECAATDYISIQRERHSLTILAVRDNDELEDRDNDGGGL